MTQSSPSVPMHPLNAQISVAPQIDASHVKSIADAGFRSIICNRPDFEHGPHQATVKEVAEEAQRQGLHFAFLPVSGGGQTPEEAMEMAKLLREMPKPILAYCRSGRRCISLISLAAHLGEEIPG